MKLLPVGRNDGASTMSVPMAPYKNILGTLKLTRNKHKISEREREGEREREREKQQCSDRKLWSEFKIETKRNFGAATEIPNQTNSRGVKYKLKSLPQKIESRRL